MCHHDRNHRGSCITRTANGYEARGRLDPTGFGRHVDFRAYLPPVELSPFIERSWTIRWQDVDEAFDNHEVMHRPYVDAFVSAGQSGIQGTFRGRRTYVAAGSGRIVGIRFRPGGFHAFWKGAIVDLQDRFTALQQMLPAADARHIDELLALDDPGAIDGLLRMLGELHPAPDRNIELVNEIIAAIEQDEELVTVEAVARTFGKSQRWLQQLFQEYVGIGPKWLLQRRRLLAAAAQLRETRRPNVAAIAYDLGYSSQQHFITDFRHVLGTTPLEDRRGLMERERPNGRSTSLS